MMYAQFSDAPDVEQETTPPEPSPQVQSGNIQFGQKQNVAQFTRPPPAQPSYKFGKLNLLVPIFLFVLFAFTLANFILVMEVRHELSPGLDSNIRNVLFNMNKTNKAKVRGQCHIEYLGKCFWAIRVELEVEGGLKACKENDAVPANIYSKLHFDMIASYLRQTKWDKKNRIWIGMTRDQKAKKNYLQNGEETSMDLRWFAEEGFPSDEIGRTRLAIHYDLDTKFTGFINEVPTAKLHGVLCEI